MFLIALGLHFKELASRRFKAGKREQGGKLQQGKPVRRAGHVCPLPFRPLAVTCGEKEAQISGEGEKASFQEEVSFRRLAVPSKHS